MRVIIDNGHGINCPGKRSPKGMLTHPDGTALFEWEFNRDVVCRLMPMLEAAKIPYDELVPESEDISLSKRVQRANDIYRADNSAFLISIHANAGGGTGFEIFTSVGQTKSDHIAEIFAQEAKKAFPEFRMRFDNSEEGVNADSDKEAHFYMLRKTICPAVLTENFFMDHEKDLAFIISDEGRQRVAKMHFDAIIACSNYLHDHGNF